MFALEPYLHDRCVVAVFQSYVVSAMQTVVVVALSTGVTR